MAKYSTKQKPSAETSAAAMKIAKQRQRPGQTKEQTKLIAEGIRKGIDDYKKQQKAKQRESNKKLKKNKNSSAASAVEQRIIVGQTQPKLAWILLLLSWISFAIYLAY